MGLTMWVHGNAVQPEDVNNKDLLIKRFGFHAEIDQIFPFNLTAPIWLQFAIPTITVLDNRRLRIRRVMMNFFTEVTTTAVRAVHVYDGPKPIAAFDNLNLALNHDLQVFDIPNTPEVFLGINVGVQYLMASTPGPHKLAIRAVGAEFQ